MKKYNRFDAHTLVLWIVFPILAFLLAMNITYAYFTAQHTFYVSTQTATLIVEFSDSTKLYSNSNAITTETSLLPGDTLSASGQIQNVGEVEAYVVLKFTLNVQKFGEANPTKILEKFYTIVSGTTTEITKNNDAYSHSAFVMDKNATNNFEISYLFDFNEYGNEYIKATVSYSLEAFALQTATLSDTAEATAMLIEQVAATV